MAEYKLVATNVEPNNGESTTAELSTLKVGEVNYSLPSGGINRYHISASCNFIYEFGASFDYDFELITTEQLTEGTEVFYSYESDETFNPTDFIKGLMKAYFKMCLLKFSLYNKPVTEQSKSIIEQIVYYSPFDITCYYYPDDNSDRGIVKYFKGCPSLLYTVTQSGILSFDESATILNENYLVFDDEIISGITKEELVTTPVLISLGYFVNGLSYAQKLTDGTPLVVTSTTCRNSGVTQYNTSCNLTITKY